MMAGFRSTPAIKRIAILSRGIQALPFLDAFLDAEIVYLRPWQRPREVDAIAGWGRRESAERAMAYAERNGLPYLALEDGFLRSFGTGEHCPPLALVVDEEGIYYDSTRPSALESLLNSERNLFAGPGENAPAARARLLSAELSKYNHAPPPEPGLLRSTDAARVLVVDQTRGDRSVTLGGADAATFKDMLEAALTENPQATVYLKTHPEVSSGRKSGYLSAVLAHSRLVLLTQPVNPPALIAQMDRVYAVTSTMGFEALLAGKPVSCFGRAWYAGWGVTDDRQTLERRARSRSVDELFSAAYCHYTRYLNPKTHEPGSFFDVADWIELQRETLQRVTGTTRPRRVFAVGFNAWKAMNSRPMLSLFPGAVTRVRNLAALQKRNPQPDERMVGWGGDLPSKLSAVAERTGAKTLRMEDGFLRSVGLGSDLIRPLSLVLDSRGIYFDPTRASDLEHLLNTAKFDAAELERAAEVRHFIVEHGLTKYNLEPRAQPSWQTQGRDVVLVPGQVEDDASIRLGCTDIRTNNALLEATRAARPDAFIVYKPHPDVVSGNRDGRRRIAEASQWADHIEPEVSVVSCIAVSAEIHTMTSLAGFDALLRGKQVVTYGQPFYAGWGLTEDRVIDGPAFKRRTRTLSLDELVAGVLLRYPIYWDWDLRGYTTCEATLRALLETRTRLEASGELEHLRRGAARRLARKGRTVIRSLCQRR